MYLDRRSIANPNEGFISQLQIYEGMLNALRSRENFLRENRLPESDDPDCQFDSDSDLVDFGLEFRVKKLVQNIHRQERASIRRSKSKLKSSRPMSSRPSTVQSAPATASDQSEPTVESEPSFSPLHDTSFSSITDIFEGKIFSKTRKFRKNFKLTS